MANPLTDKEVLSQIQTARDQPATSEPRARAVRFHPSTGLVAVELSNGCRFAFPAGLVEALQGIGPKELRVVEVSPSGLGLRWPLVDVDLSVPALLQGMFGGKVWMTELARSGGHVRSEAKARAARLNGARGGRPRKPHAVTPQ